MSQFLIPLAFVVAMLIGLVGFAQWRYPRTHAVAAIRARDQLRTLAPRLPFALIAAECIGRLLPHEHVTTVLGAEAGIPGLLLASALGAFLPGGPMVAFPLALALLRAGASPATLVALITAWSLMAFTRTLLFEVPLLGTRFTFWRIAASVPLPFLAGLIAAAVNA